MEIEEEKKQIFASTVCPICGLCSNPDPKFCSLLYYNGDAEQFTREIVKRIAKLRKIFPDLREILSTFEGFSSLFCKPDRCPLYDKSCEEELSSRVVCYRSFVSQNDTQLKLPYLSNIYKKWSGVSLEDIGKFLDPIMNVDEKSLSKKQKKKLRKAMKKFRKTIRNDNTTTPNNNANLNKNRMPVIYKKKSKKLIKTLFFHNSNNAWEEKISQYLGENGRNENNNRQSSEVTKPKG